MAAQFTECKPRYPCILPLEENMQQQHTHTTQHNVEELDPNDKDAIKRQVHEQMTYMQRARALKDELRFSKVVELQSKNLG